ncbi:MAG TPA: efflux RND transporter periplasmic adaptor subunit [Rhizomicrobium sp.]|jgi:HlyD family secretion protein|nr:efflux RND transporter periplasmic adaptor subunit [Rhizomicrobium sp.]
MNQSLAAVWRGMLRHKSVAILLGLFAAVAVTFVGFSRGGSVQYVTAKIVRGDIRDVVEANGTVSAVTTVLVGSQVSGTIAKLYADFNSRVHKGQVIALIDPALFQGALQGALADFANATANVAASEANLAKAQATLEQTKADFVRAGTLIRGGAESQQAFDLAKANYRIAAGSVGAAEATLTQARAQVQQKRAAVQVAQTNLNYTTIHSPIDGTIVARNVDVGQTVEASLQAPTIFTIAQDLTKMQVYVKTDESDEGRIRVGSKVTFKVDAFPKDVFEGRVSQKRMNATTVQNVVTYDTIVDFNNPGQKLFPGMTAFVTIPVATVTNVLEIPNTALRYMPPLAPEKIRNLYAQFGIDAEASENATRQAGSGGRHETAVIWKLGGSGTIEPVQIETGITDHAYTQIVGVDRGTLGEGNQVVTASIDQKIARP